jgi:hypothetical protein
MGGDEGIIVGRERERVLYILHGALFGFGQIKGLGGLTVRALG